MRSEQSWLFQVSSCQQHRRHLLERLKRLHLVECTLRTRSDILSPRRSSRTSSSCIPVRARTIKCVFGERACKCLFTRDLLTANEAVNSNSYGTINVVSIAVFTKSHLGKGFADAEDGFEMTDLQHWLVHYAVVLCMWKLVLTVMGYAPVASDSRLMSANNRAILS